ncbi:hypothetical protein [Neobacillus cucumis]|uniref:Uncharacterized protein n=1 Tax=Neobacillus cucumis TaxID=1740721 RepID=A0A2N5HFJ2_9BACI|nr:hypothetical protein [Neobacillus cucumis]PLS04299.1 hypothetical protein CVD27_12440 [Neobacillus cucumis]
MRKFIMITGLFFILFILAGFLADYFYYGPVKQQEVKKGMLKQLSSKYGKDFIVNHIIYEKALGDDEGMYSAEVYPKGNKDLEFQVFVSENGKLVDESFKETKWRSEAIKSWEPFMSKFGNITYAVNIHIPEEIAEQYSVEDTYEEIYQKHKHLMSEYVFIGQIEKSFDKKKETARVIEMANHALQRELKDFSVEWTYYEKGKKNADVFELRDTVPSYSWRFSRKGVSNGVTAESLEPFFTQH